MAATLSPRKKDEHHWSRSRQGPGQLYKVAESAKDLDITGEAPEVLHLNIPKEFSVAFSHGCESERGPPAEFPRTATWDDSGSLPAG
ncbi:hypothetical protein [Tunturiibacter lichenicola]|uniref:hypothetical protein n=1 Tax=Tunturiibacter lichenicola TaxID=2051959 RepID=UPI0021B1A231|nr:hypothetical protein [Edaphobacter lichenicola]